MTITGKVETIRRLQSSKNGNPRFAVTIDGNEYKTEPDSGLAYGIESPEYYDNVHTFHVNGRGNIDSTVKDAS